MATQLFFRFVASDYSTGHNDARLRDGAGTNWNNRALSLSRGASVKSLNCTSLAGPTSGIEAGGSATAASVWYSPPLDADITISGSITWNLRAGETSNSANASVNARLEVIDGATGTITLIDQTARTTECSTAEGVNNFSETPGAGVACKRGDRLRVRVYFDDAAANMGSGFALQFFYDGPTAAASGDSYFTLTENLAFVSEPAGTTIYPTDTASAVSTASVDREAWTSRGAGVQTDVTNTVAGYTAPLQVTDTAGGTVVDWFTRQLAAFTLGGAVRVNARMLESSSAANVAIRCEVARVASDGTSPTVWAATTGEGEIGTTELVGTFLISGDDLAVSDGQRLRVRFYFDDANSGGAMGASQTATLYYAGTSGGASGDTYLTFSQTLTEYTAGGAVSVTPTTAALVVTKNAPTVTASNHQRVTPTTKALTSARFAPTVRTPILATPAAVSLAATKYAPTVTTSAHQRVTPTTATLTATRYAPTVRTPQLVTATTRALVLTKYAPTVTASNHQAVTPTTKTLTITRYAPTVSVVEHGVTVTPTTKALGLSPNAPVVTTSNNQRVTPTTKALTMAQFAPAVTSSNHQRVTPITTTLTATRYAPAVTASAHQRVTPTTKALTVTRYAPSVGQPAQVQPTTRALVLATFAPTISTTANVRIVPATLAVTLTELPPTAVTTAHQLMIVQFASLTVAGFAPSVETHSGTALPDPIYGWGSVIGGGVALPEVDGGPAAGVGTVQGGARVAASEGGSTAVSTSGPSARVTIR